MSKVGRRIRVLPEGLECRPRIDGAKMIAAYLKITPLALGKLRKITANSWDPIPLFTLTPGAGQNSMVSAFIDELDAWMDRRSQPAPVE